MGKTGTGISPARGRPKKKIRKGTARKNNYRTSYNSEDMARAVAQVKKQKMSVREAALEYGVKRSTLHDIVRGKVAEGVGRPTVLDKEEEKLIVERLLLMSEWGFPMTCKELRHLIKAYLDGLGKTTRFVGNLPGPHFVKRFMKRHPTLTVRTTSMIKRARAAVSSKVVEDFFKRFTKTAEGVPPTHIYNYDESGLKDDPGADKAIFRKGVKHAEQIRDYTKSQISVMFCGTAAGRLLPPYVVYKAANCWESWRQRGPDGARYSATASGCFEGCTFTFT